MPLKSMMQPQMDGQISLVLKGIGSVDNLKFHAYRYDCQSSYHQIVH